MKFYEEQFNENQWFASCRLLALALAHSLLGILLPLSVVPGNLAIWHNLLLIHISLEPTTEITFWGSLETRAGKSDF